MAVDNNKLREFMYDPTKLQHYVLQELEKEGYQILHANNPFMFALEAAITTASNTLVECNNIIRKKYPNLASKLDHLYHHATEEDLMGIYYIPSEANITFFINMLDITRDGYRPYNANYRETTIPEGTTIDVLGRTFTVLNDIIVRLYDNNSIFIEQIINNNPISYKDVSILPGEIFSSADSTPWIKFSTMVKQVKLTTVESSIIASEGYKKSITMQDNYYFSNIFYRNDLTLDKWVELYKTHTDEYIDINKPTIYISLYNKDVNFRLPDPYVVSGKIYGNIQVNLYETIGKLYLPLNKLLPDDFNIKFNNTGKNLSTASVENIAIMCRSDWVVDGGSNGLTLDEFRDSIINNTMGSLKLPITDKQLAMSGKLDGFDIFKLDDVITHRTYLAMRSLPDVESDLIYAKHDAIFGTVTIVIEDLENSSFVNIGLNSTTINAGAVLKNDNGLIRIAKEEEMQYIAGLRSIALINYLENNKFYYCPFYYVIHHDETYSKTTIYNLDTPRVNNIKILNKNNNIIYKANVDKYGISKTKDGYRIAVTLTTNSEFDTLNQEEVYMQLKLELNNGDYVYYNSKYDKEFKAYVFDIGSNFTIDSYDNIYITGGNSNTFTKYTPLNNKMLLYTITTDKVVVDENKYLQQELYITEGNKEHVVVTKEELDITLGDNLSNLYNRLYNTYTGRKYKKHKKDVYEVYTEDVFEVKDKTGTIFECVQDTLDNGNKYILDFKVLHKKGDIVKDKDGNPVIKYREGENILDENGNPIVDRLGGVVRYVDMLLLEYEFLKTTNSDYKAYTNMAIDCIRSYVLSSIPSINNRLLDNTTILYKSYKTLSDIEILANNSIVKVPYIITPNIVLYISNTNALSVETQDNYINIIGNILNKHLDNLTIVLENIKKDIKVALGETIVGVKITGIDPANSEIINIRDKLKRFIINKALSLNKNNELIVKYNIKLDIQYIK